jgi:hypothetical protein
METRFAAVMNRRRVLGSTLGATAVVAMPFALQGKVILQRGIVGGGLAQFELSEAQFSFFASRFEFEEENREVIVGSVLWVDVPSGFSFVSTSITSYGTPEDTTLAGEVRRILGMMQVNEGETYPFSLEVADAEGPGSGQDYVILTVGDGAILGGDATPAAGYGFSYAAAGPVTVGDIQEVNSDINSAMGTEIAATPTA